jgi:hypothetical protein
MLKLESTHCRRLFMNVKSPPLAKLILLGALLTGCAAMAQTTSSNLETQASKTQNFAGELAKADLAKQGITTPNQGQLAASTQNIQGMRTSGMGWGAIANSLGLRLGEVVSAANRNKNADDAKPAKTEKSASKNAQHAGREGSHDGNQSGGSGGNNGRGGNGGGGNGGGGNGGGGNGGGGGGGGGRK